MEENASIDFAAFASRMFYHKPGDCDLLWNGFNDESDLERFLRIDAPWPTHGAIWRKASLERVKLQWDEAARSWQDWEFHIRALAAGLKGTKVPEVDCFFRAAASGSVSHSSFSRAKVLNRARMLNRLSECIKEHDRNNELNRRLLAALFFRHAFSSGLRRREAFLVGRMANQTGLVSSVEYYTVLLSRAVVWLAARSSRVLETFAVPELPKMNQGTHLKATIPWVGPARLRSFHSGKSREETRVEAPADGAAIRGPVPGVAPLK
jgi:hypothetical protein